MEKIRTSKRKRVKGEKHGNEENERERERKGRR
jgi:hypothetical protein